MSSKEILERICRYANQQCKLHNVDVDFMKDFILLYIPGYWTYAIGNFKNFMLCDKDGQTFNIGVNVPWHLISYEEYIYDIHPFSPEVPLIDEAYDIIVKNMLGGCQIYLNAKDADKIEEQLKQLKHKFKEDAKNIFFNKHSNSNYLNDAKALMDDYHYRSTALQNKAHPKIILVPNDVLSIEELQIWLDLNADE